MLQLDAVQTRRSPLSRIARRVVARGVFATQAPGDPSATPRYRQGLARPAVCTLGWTLAMGSGEHAAALLAEVA